MKVIVSPLTANGVEAIRRGAADSQKPTFAQRIGMSKAACRFTTEDDNLVIFLENEKVMMAQMMIIGERGMRRRFSKSIQKEIMSVNGAKPEDYKVRLEL